MGRLKGELRTSTKSQQKIANKILKSHLTSSEKFVTDKISGKFFKQQLTNSQMADGLNEFSRASGTKQVYNASKIPSNSSYSQSLKDLAQRRKENPKLFDQVVLQNGPKTKPRIPDDIRKNLTAT